MLPELQSGGVERGTLEIGRALVEAGCRSVVVSGGGRLVSQLTEQGSEHIQMAVGRKNPLTLLLIGRLRRLLRQLQPDILHLRSRLPAWIGYWAWRGLPAAGRPHLVTTVHGLYSVSRYSSIMTRGEAVIAVSQTVRDYILQNYPEVSPERIEVIFRGVDPKEFHPAADRAASWAKQLRQELQCPSDRRLILFPGRVTRGKGLALAIELLRSLVAEGQDVQLVVAGEVRRNKQRFLREMQRMAAQAEVEQRISWLGYRSEMHQLYAASDLVLHLGKRPEAFGRVAAEAVATGTPVIGWDQGGIGEILHQSFPFGAIPCEGIELLQARVAEILLTDRHSEQVRTDCFPLQRMQEQTLSLYRRLLG